MNTTQVLFYMVIAHILADFPLQSDTMVRNKGYLTVPMAWHIAIVTCLTALFTWNPMLGLAVGIVHYVIDVLKVCLQSSKRRFEPIYLFIGDQLLHLISLWFLVQFITLNELPEFKLMHFTDSTLLQGQKLTIAALFSMYPSSYIVKLSIQHLLPIQSSDKDDITTMKIQQAGKLIGQLERLLILCFVFVHEYAAIGMIMAGKSIIRIGDKNSKEQSEYLIIGTILSVLLGVGAGLLACKL